MRPSYEEGYYYYAFPEGQIQPAVSERLTVNTSHSLLPWQTSHRLSPFLYCSCIFTCIPAKKHEVRLGVEMVNYCRRIILDRFMPYQPDIHKAERSRVRHRRGILPDRALPAFDSAAPEAPRSFVIAAVCSKYLSFNQFHSCRLLSLFAKTALFVGNSQALWFQQVRVRGERPYVASADERMTTNNAPEDPVPTPAEA